ncbi:MAG: hypothetical protein B1H11_09430 [Desulfobacteraceae bacterium 4484_190.1]|nr:MAG: hypothetical protein B1H11_09430 [Desulfobacteraceae bacterium 4484_190.1]
MSIWSQISRYLNQLIAPLGIRLINRQSSLDWDVCLKRFKGLGFNPTTVIDIGVAQGTLVLYRNFPDTYYILIDPLREAVPFMKTHCQRFAGGGGIP